MKEKKILKAQKKLEKAIMRYIKLFEKKQGMYFEFWVNDEVGGVAFFGDFHFNFFDIKTDLEKNAPKYAIIEWYDINLMNYGIDKPFINYETYLKTRPKSDFVAFYNSFSGDFNQAVKNFCIINNIKYSDDLLEPYRKILELKGTENKTYETKEFNKTIS